VEETSVQNSVNQHTSRRKIIDTQIRLHLFPFSLPCQGPLFPYVYPLKDENPSRSTPFVNYALVFANTLIFLYEITLTRHAQAVLANIYGTVPTHYAQLLAGRGNIEAALIPLFTSMFLHAGPAHLLGNMLFLWIFGDNVEDFFGHIGYLAFYLFAEWCRG